MIYHYHWCWYLIGLICCPKLTFMIFLSLYVPNIPLPLMIIGWIIAIIPSISMKDK